MSKTRSSRFFAGLASVYEEGSDDGDSPSAIELRRQHILESMAKLEGRPASQQSSSHQTSSPSRKDRMMYPHSLLTQHQPVFFPHFPTQAPQLPMSGSTPCLYYYPQIPMHPVYHPQFFQPQQVQAAMMMTPQQPNIYFSTPHASPRPATLDPKGRNISTSVPPRTSLPQKQAFSSHTSQQTSLTPFRPNVDQRFTYSPEVNRTISKPQPQLTRPSQEPPNQVHTRRVSSAYTDQLRSVTGTRLAEKNRLSIAEVKLMETLPPLPPHTARSPHGLFTKEVSQKKQSKKKDDLSWLDY